MYTPTKSPERHDPVALGLANEIDPGQLMNAETDDCIAVSAATGKVATIDVARTRATIRLAARGDMDFNFADICATYLLKTVRMFKSVLQTAYARMNKNKEEESYLFRTAF